MMKRQIRYMRLLPAMVAALLLAACASMGRPDGGERDSYPPVPVRSNPMPGALNVSGKKITIYFDENVQLDNPNEKVVVSPAQKQNPVVSSNGRRVTVELRDSLLPNTTYTIDFADAIKDLNEGNVLDGFAIDFSTGPTIDSLRISGIVLEAATLEPAQGMLVGAYLDDSDTAITTRRFDRITKTNQMGQFTLRNLKEGSYRVYALKDNNRDFHWDRSEDIAFYDSLVTPWAKRVEALDTVRNSRGEIDSIATIEVTRYYPNDLLLTWFNENYLAQYLKEYTRPDRRRLVFTLGAPSDTFPTLRMLNGPHAGIDLDELMVLQTGAGHDTLTYWIGDSLLLAQDSMLIEATYQRVDDSDSLVWKTDTLKLNLRPAKKAEPRKEKKKEGDEAADSLPQIEYMPLKPATSGSVDLNQPLVLESETPITALDTARIALAMLVDTVWTPVKPPHFQFPHSLNHTMLIADYDWRPATKYKLTVDTAAIYDLYGLYNAPIELQLTTRAEADYSNLFLNIQGLDSIPAVVELLNGSGTMVRSTPVVNGTATFLYVNPGTYYARLYLDANGNGKWDTGNLKEKRQPEEVYYYPKALQLRKNWDVEQKWNIYELPVDTQKPDKIKKNKPKRKPGEKLPKEEPLDDEYDDMNNGDNFGNFSPNPYNTNNGSTYNPNNIGRRR